MQDGEVWVHSNNATKHWTEIAGEPVWVSMAEATAFCTAQHARLMTEPEYMRLLDRSAVAGNAPRLVPNPQPFDATPLATPALTLSWCCQLQATC